MLKLFLKEEKCQDVSGPLPGGRDVTSKGSQDYYYKIKKHLKKYFCGT